MSAGHAAHRDDVPDIDDAFYARVKILVDDCKRDRDHTIPWLANRTIDGRTCLIDSIVPQKLPITGIDTGETLPYHELGEWLGMNEGLDYDTSHAARGNPCEKRRVEELGGNWDDYQAEMAGYIRLVGDEAMTNVPADIDKRVFIDDDDTAALEAILADNKGFRSARLKSNDDDDDLRANANEIIAGLWLGSAKACAPAKALGFECMSVFEVPWCKTSGCSHFPIMADDEKVDPQILTNAVDQLQSWVVTGKSVLVHCRKGVERSPLTVAVWMRDHSGMSLDQAYELIAKQRPQIEDRREWLGDDNKGLRMTAIRKFVAGSIVADATLGPRQILVVASDATPDRAKDVMVPSGCKIDNYQKNNIVLADHDATKPIGNAEIIVSPENVKALITFAPAGISAKCDEYCALAKAGVIKSVSVGFDPMEAEPIKGGGFKYKAWELMELSVLGGVPCNPNAVIIARSAEASKHEWKVGASLNLPVAGDVAGNPSGRAQAILAKAGTEWAWAKKGFLAYDPAAPAEAKSYDLPFAEVVDGRMVVTRASLRAAAVGIASLPGELKEKARAVINHYEAKMKTKIGAPKVKGLYGVCELARALCDLGYIHEMSVWEAECEQDGSKVPAMLADILRQAANALVAMTAEETAELLEGHGIEILPEDEVYVAAAATPQAKALRAAFRKAARVKAGRALSAANLGHLVEMHKCMKAMADCYTKAADLHDDLHDQIEEWMSHGTSAGEHHKAIMKSAGKKPDGTDAEDDGDVADPADADNELSADAAQRKRTLDLLERSAA